MRTSMIRSVLQFSVASLTLFVAAAGALGQANPFDPAPPARAGANPFEAGGNAAANPLAPANPAAPATETPLAVPDFIKPGGRFVYSMGATNQPDDPSLQGTTSDGFFVRDVIAVTPTRVLLAGRSYVRDGGSLNFVGVTPIAYRERDVTGAGALWMPAATLQHLAAGGGGSTTVVPTKIEAGGRVYEATALTWRGGDESIRRTTFDKGTGLLLGLQQATGKPLRNAAPNEFNRRNNSIELFQSFRQLALPWYDAAPPAWTRTVNRMVYEGQYSMGMQGLPPVTFQSRITFEVQERGDDFLAGMLSTEMQNVAPTKAPFIVATRQVDPSWISPDALRQMKPGVLDQDPTVGSVLSYRVQNGDMGPCGVVTETNAAGTYGWTQAYRLSDGALVYFETWDGPRGVKRSYSLRGME